MPAARETWVKRKQQLQYRMCDVYAYKMTKKREQESQQEEMESHTKYEKNTIDEAKAKINTFFSILLA